MLATVAVLSLVLPNNTVAVPGPVYATPQLVFVAIISFALYALFLFVQMVRHRGDFSDPRLQEFAEQKPGRRQMGVALALLPIALLSVVLLAESLAPTVEHAVAREVSSGTRQVEVAIIMPGRLTVWPAVKLPYFRMQPRRSALFHVSHSEISGCGAVLVDLAILHDDQEIASGIV